MPDISKLSIILTASAEQFKSGLKGAEHSLHTFVDHVKEGIHEVTNVFAGLAATLGPLEAFRAFKDQEQAVAKLNAVLTSTGEAAGFSSAELQEVARSLEETTTFGDEATIAAEAVLATF